MFARLVLAYVLSLPLFVSLTPSAVPVERYTLQITMSSSVPGLVQVFFDTGAGFSGAQSSAESAVASTESREYRLSLPAGRYRQLRLDPGTEPGRYSIQRAAIIGSDGSTITVLPLADLNPVQELTTVERTATSLVLDATPGATDPQILYAPSSPLTIAPSGKTAAALLVRFALILAGAALVVWVVEQTLIRVWPGGSQRFYVWPRGPMLILRERLS